MQIRYNIFETNSSSTHSFIIDSSEHRRNITYEELKTKKNTKKISIPTGEYGWGYDELETPWEKMSYMATYAVISNQIDDFEQTLSEYLNIQVKIKIEDGYGIDHQSIDRAAEMYENLIDTIFRAGGVIIIDNDNH